jgi:hypothetical protein
MFPAPRNPVIEAQARASARIQEHRAYYARESAFCIDEIDKSKEELLAELQALRLKIIEESSDEAKTLRLVHVTIDEPVASELASLIQARSWKSIIVADCRGPPPPFNLVVTHAMSRSKRLHLQQLTRPRFYPDGRHLDIAPALVNALRSNQTLRYLNLSELILTDSGITALALAIGENSCLKCLHLYRTNVDRNEKGAK